MQNTLTTVHDIEIDVFGLADETREVQCQLSHRAHIRFHAEQTERVLDATNRRCANRRCRLRRAACHDTHIVWRAPAGKSSALHSIARHGSEGVESPAGADALSSRGLGLQTIAMCATVSGTEWATTSESRFRQRRFGRAPAVAARRRTGSAIG